ncbi:hypothetical protein HJC23_006019 [Cyclotella cryptica]|uniref:Kinesin light chain n=1 Tax=Cyclotella cryptica TaxID=29204 RepID=A0ABD3NYK5_9STRA|eukprot:CCRYP_019810-RA/>CCRYP_019810-RA protein AED:0.00 eAED:0.00 QI:92/-1/1/1/-1/1/1/2127/617
MIAAATATMRRLPVFLLGSKNSFRWHAHAALTRSSSTVSAASLAVSTRRRPFSTASSSPDRPIEVTVTSSNAASDDARSVDDVGSGGRPGSLAKSADQVAEERILSLQATLRSHHRSASFSSALDISQELLALALSHFGKLHPATASAYNNVGLMHKCLGNYHDAKEAYEQALQIYGQVCGKDHGSYAAALSNLGMLERGRVLEQLDDDEDSAHTESSLMEAQNHTDERRDYNTDNGAASSQKTKLSSLERLQLNELAIEYFDEAYRIRLAELGSTHPHTIASRSQLGSAMAYSVIMERRNKLSSAAGKGGLIEKELRTMKHQYAVTNEAEMENYIPLAVARAASKSMETSSKLTRRRWEAAEEHLRGALTTAVEDPRGESVNPLEYLPIADDTDAGVGAVSTGKGLFVKDRSLSKKDRRKAAKDAKREKRLANANALHSMPGDSSTNIHGNMNKIAIQGVARKVTTLSAATAAQNLAVFLKNYSDWLRLSLLDDPSKYSDSEASHLPQQQQQRGEQLRLLSKVIQEARHLYEASLHVRTQLLAPHHPDVVATKFSLAELLDAPKEGLLGTYLGDGVSVVGGESDGRRANALREEILSAYNVEERDEDTNNSTANST